MKKNFFVKVLVGLLFCAVFSTSVNAQSVFSKGDNIVNAGLGLGNPHSPKIGDVFLTNEYKWKIAVPPISASYETCIIDNLFNDKSAIGVGGYLGFASYKRKITDSRYTSAIFGVRGAFHYQLVDNLDTYAGVMAGYRIGKYTNSTYKNDPGFASDTFLGARYYLMDNLGVFAEVGWGGIGYLQLGVTLKF